MGRGVLGAQLASMSIPAHHPRALGHTPSFVLEVSLMSPALPTSQHVKRDMLVMFDMSAPRLGLDELHLRLTAQPSVVSTSGLLCDVIKLV